MVRLLLLLLAVALPAQADPRDAPRLELVLDAREAAPFEGEMVLGTLRGTYRQNIAREELKLRPMADFDWVRLGLDRWSEERVDGLPARIFERRIAFYPRRPGDLEIPPIAHALEISGPDGRRDSVIVRSAPVALAVQPSPAVGGARWLPLRALELSESWDADPARLADGQSVTRRVVLRAFGATPEMLPQQPALRQPWLISFTPPEERHFQVTQEGPVSTLVWTWHLRPVTGEPGVIPPVEIPWFDTGERAPRVAVIPAAAIGYASFAGNAASGWRSVAEIGHGSWLLAGLSALIATAAAFRERRAPSWLRGAIARRLRLFRLRRRVRAGDLAVSRQMASQVLQDLPGLGEDQRLGHLRPVDELLYGELAADRPGRLRKLYARTRKAALSRRQRG
ncbi:BatD family protein [Poseidonocella sp. HB161398]|uniref:BatD family protein n=1 Tax=Poseidonocella sp. HB161398 TaxID=2320855 RepID=UPI001108FB88|nr:BatD family protein [Poseidonocella sp. HB161398]